MVDRNQTPEQKARDNIDKMLELAGWKVQSKKKIDFNATLGVAVREFDTDVGPADYVLWTKEVSYYDYRTNVHHTLKKKPMRFEDLADFIECYNPENWHDRKPTWDAGKIRKDVGASFPTRSLSRETKPAWTCSGSRTRA